MIAKKLLQSEHYSDDYSIRIGKRRIRLHAFFFNRQDRRLYSDLIIVALETSNKIGMRGRRSFGVTVGVMAAQTLTIFSEALVDFWMQTN